MYSDGVTEAQNSAKDLFGQERLMEALHEQRAESLGQCITTLLRKIEAWCGRARFQDDVSIVALEMT